MNDHINETSGTGYLYIKASTASGAIPIEGATVNVRGSEQENSGIILSLITNSAGATPKVPLPAPPRRLSESPSVVIPYALYDVDVFKNGYTPLHFKDVAVFDSVTSIQPAIMIPLADGEANQSYNHTKNNRTI